MAKDPVWNHFNGDRIKANCKYCNASYTSGKIKRMVEHILKRCDKIPATARSELRSALAPQRPISAPPQLSRDSLLSPPAKRKHIHTSLDTYIRTMSSEDLQHSQELLIKALVTGGVPLNFLENDDFKAFVHALHPGFVVPNRQRSQKEIVSKLYKEEKTVVDNSIANAPNVAISTDGWQDINKKKIMNFIVHTPSEWLHSFQPEIDSDANYLSSKILEVIKEIGPEKVAALVSDHASNAVKAAKLVAEEYPWITHSGCQGHGLNLGCKDICNTKIFKLLLSKCKLIYDLFRYKHSAAALTEAFVNQKLKEKKLQTAVLTRFATHYTSIKSIVYARNAIREACNYPKLDKQTNISAVRRIVNDTNFWMNLNEMLSILKPLSLTIFKLESNLLEFGDGRNAVKLAFIETLNKVEHSNFSSSFKAILTKHLQKRQKFCSNDLDYVYTLLDPRQKGEGLTPAERTLALKRINKIKQNPRIDETKLDLELRLWAECGGKFNRDAYPEAWESLDTNITPKQWWMLYFKETDLCKLLSMIVSTPLTSAASERTWSVRGFVHSKARNRLSLSSADKLVFLKYNLALKKSFTKKREKAERDGNEADNIEDYTVEISINDEDVTINDEYQIEEEEYDSDLEDEYFETEHDTNENEYGSEVDYFSSSEGESSDEERYYVHDEDDENSNFVVE